jgi:hypothetical protein
MTECVSGLSSRPFYSPYGSLIINRAPGLVYGMDAVTLVAKGDVPHVYSYVLIVETQWRRDGFVWQDLGRPRGITGACEMKILCDCFARLS